MSNTVVRKKNLKDRRDGYYLKDIDSMHVIMPYVMPHRIANEAVLGEIVDITAINDYINEKNSHNPDFKYTWFHVIAAALAKTIQLRPKMNWFISGDRLYERRDIVIAFNVKKKFADDGEEAIAKFVLDRNGGSPVDQVHDYVRDIVTKVRVKGEQDGATDAMDIFKKLPRFAIKIAFWVLRRLEYHGLYPKSLQKEDPMYSSVYVSNLGSIKMSAHYHHIYEWGTISFFTVISERQMTPVFAADGSHEMKETIRLAFTIDERIADGYYFAQSIKLMRQLLQNPDLLDLDAAAAIEF